MHFALGLIGVMLKKKFFKAVCIDIIIGRGIFEAFVVIGS